MAKRTLSLAVGVALAAGITSFGAVAGASSASAAGQCSIAPSNLSVVATNQTHSNDTTQAFDVFKVSYELNNLDGMAAGSCITFAAPAQFTTVRSTTMNLLAPDGSLIGTQTMDKGVVTVTLTTDYAATHTAVKVWGSYTAKISDSIAAGATVPLNFTVNGTVTKTQDITTTTCIDCTAMPVGYATKDGQDANGKGEVGIMTPVVPEAGTVVTIKDTLTSTGQNFAGMPIAYGYTSRNQWGSIQDVVTLPVTQLADGTWTVKTARANEAIRLLVPMTFTGAGPWKDTADISYPGQHYQASTTVINNTVDGGGQGTKPAPDVPVPPAGKPVPPKPVVKTQSYTAQVDTYTWKNSAAYGTKIAKFDDDFVLRYREDGFLWMTKAAKKYTTYGHTFVTFTAPVNATKAQLVAAYNAKAPAALRITTTAQLGNKVAKSGKVTDVWVLGKGATAKAAWGATKNVNQVFIGRR